MTRPQWRDFQDSCKWSITLPFFFLICLSPNKWGEIVERHAVEKEWNEVSEEKGISLINEMNRNGGSKKWKENEVEKIWVVRDWVIAHIARTSWCLTQLLTLDRWPWVGSTEDWPEYEFVCVEHVCAWCTCQYYYSNMWGLMLYFLSVSLFLPLHIF